MIDSISYIISDDTVPYRNLALEEYLLFNVKKNEVLLYLWQNKNTVVVGKNQNVYKECKVDELIKNGGYVVRRLSGGGAVFHDLGNLNFTFIARCENSNVEKQLNVILVALNSIGIRAKFSGRNDITVDGKKFSGNAFYKSNEYCYHHGTLLVSADIGSLSKYLNVSPLKLKSKGVDSVKSRVVNLTEYKKDLTIGMLMDSLVLAFSKCYGGLTPKKINVGDIDMSQVLALEEKYSSDDFVYSHKFDFEVEVNDRFSWGEIQILINLKGGKIDSASVYSDALDERYISQIPGAIIGTCFLIGDIAAAIDKVPCDGDLNKQMAKDIKNLLCKRVLA